MKWHHYIMIRLSLFLLLGILIGFNFSLDFTWVLSILILSLLLLIARYIYTKKRFKSGHFFSLITYLTMINLGVFTVYIHQDNRQENHYLALEKDTNQTITLRITKILKPDKYHQKYYAKIKQIDSLKSQGKVIVLLQDNLKNLQIGDVFVVRSTLKAIHKAKNPYSFDYAHYLKNKQIFRQLTVAKYHFIKQEKSLKSISESWRNTLISRLENKGFSPDEFAVFKGLLLGDKTSISKAIRNDYSQAGAMHILAISGLHIGILLLILNFLLKPLEKIKKGKLIKTILIIILLWLYALFTGLSPSVVRAVTMFSFVSIGINYKRYTNIINTLFSALFILLLFNPFYIYELGFQLSFIAVFGIVLIQPKIVHLLTIKNKFLNYFWQIFTVSLSAQLSILPLSLYYFHQFPALFFLTNMLIIPALTIILVLGILTLIIASFNIVFSPLIVIYNNILLWTNQFTHWVASKEHFVFQHIPFDVVQLSITYLFLIFFIRLLHLKNGKTILYLLSFVILFQGYIHYKKKQNINTNEWLIFYKSRQSILAKKQAEKLYVFTTDSTASKASFIKNYKMNKGIKQENILRLKNWYNFDDKKLFIVDSLGIYKTTQQADYILLSQSPKINLERLISWHQPKYIIADGSNYRSYIKQWENTCIKKGIPFWNTYSLGAFRKK